jgi:hypothetical protein
MACPPSTRLEQNRQSESIRWQDHATMGGTPPFIDGNAQQRPIFGFGKFIWSNVFPLSNSI